MQKSVPDYMVMGERGMADMGDMQMLLPDNTAPMMTGKGPYGGVEMGGMFSMVKVRRDQKPGDYSDPGWYKQPHGTQAYEWKGALPEAPRQSPSPAATPAAKAAPGAWPATEVQIRKPAAGAGHEGHH
jgi:hypothetical protein